MTPGRSPFSRRSSLLVSLFADAWYRKWLADRGQGDACVELRQQQTAGRPRGLSPRARHLLAEEEREDGAA